MKGTYGVGLFSTQPGGKGVPILPATTLGICENIRSRILGGIEALRGVGSWNPVELAAGMASTNFSFDIAAVQEINFIGSAATRDVNGELPYLTMGLGYKKAADEYAWQIQDCKVTRMGLRVGNRGFLTAAIELIGGKVLAGDTGVIDLGAMSFPSEYAYKYYEGVWSEGEILDFSVDVNHNVSAEAVIAGPATTRDPARIWDYLDEGDQEISGEITARTSTAALGAEPGVHDDCPAGANVTLLFTSLCVGSPSQTLQIALTGLKPVDNEFTIPRGDNIVFRMPFLATAIAIT